MRTARLVGLSSDGRYVIVSTDRGEELAIAADDRLRAALRGDRPRLGQLEIEMESALSPREIQTRIRSGESVEDVARVAGIDRERVERFAAPVIAEREHVAGLAMTSSARRRGETSSHRTLRGVLNERLLNRGVDIDTVQWDSYRLEDGRWAVTAEYRSGETPRQALFFFDVPGRFSVSGNDEGRWVLGDVSPSRGPQPGGRPPGPGRDDDEDTEPTVDLSDELALVRVIQDIPVAPTAGPGPSAEITGVGAGDDEAGEDEAGDDGAKVPGRRIADVVPLSVVTVAPAEDERMRRERPEAPRQTTAAQSRGEVSGREETVAGARATAAQHATSTETEPAADDAAGLDALSGIFDDQNPERTAVTESGLSDASAVPALQPTLRPDGWEPAIVVDYPIEPGEDPDAVQTAVEVAEGSDDPGRPEPPVAEEDRWDEAETLQHPDLEPTEPQPTEPAESEPTEPEAPVLPLDLPAQPVSPTPKPVRRKRASVPSWDEIVFGGPKEK